MGQCSEGRARTLEQPINKGACNGLRITFSNEAESMKEGSGPIVVDQNEMLQGLRVWRFLQASVWKLRHWRASVALQHS